jgi:hypothetical protein
MENENVRIVEINGVKIEVDLRTAKKIENYKVGDRVKLLLKKYNEYVSYPGVIAGFDEFKNLPTLVIAYLENGYSGNGLNFSYVNSETKDTEICAAKDYELTVSKESVLEYFDRERFKKERELSDLSDKRSFFERNYARYFEGSQ